MDTISVLTYANISPGGDTPLIIATKKQNADFVAKLLDSGAAGNFSLIFQLINAIFMVF